jgi:hypothetical protein
MPSRYEESPTSYVHLLNESEVCITEPPLASYDLDGAEEEEEEEAVDGEEEEEDGDDLEEVDQGVFDDAKAADKKRRTINYTPMEDTVLCKAWTQVSLDAVRGTDQTGKSYWLRIEDRFFKILPPMENPVDRTYRSLQGRWDVIKAACSRWSGALEQVRGQPLPSGRTIDEIDSIAMERYKEMAGSKGKAFNLQHCWRVLEHTEKWKLREEEGNPRKGALIKLDDEEEEGTRGDRKEPRRLKNGSRWRKSTPIWHPRLMRW